MTVRGDNSTAVQAFILDSAAGEWFCREAMADAGVFLVFQFIIPLDCNAISEKCIIYKSYSSIVQ